MDHVVAEKAASIERCLARVRDKYVGHEREFLDDHDIQDIVVLNLVRACQGAVDMAMRVGRRRRLDVPASSADIFRILAKAGLIDARLADSMAAMVGFRNVATHEYRALDLEKVRQIIEGRLGELRAFSQAMIKASSGC